MDWTGADGGWLERPAAAGTARARGMPTDYAEPKPRGAHGAATREVALTFESMDPTTGETLNTYEGHGPDELERRLDRAWSAFEAHRRTSFESRAAALQRAAALLEAEKLELGRLMTREMGKPIGAAVSEAEKCAWVCRYYAENGEAQLADRVVDVGDDRAFVRHQPLGPVLAIMPWNFPFWQVFRFAAPALMAGNVGLLKHAPNVPGCALAIEDLLHRAGFQDGVFQTLLIDVDAVPGVLEDARVRAATLTGSVGAGAAVAAEAGRRIKKTVLELGGSDPFIVMPSADVQAALRTGVRSRTLNNGQSCIAAKRFILHEDIYDEFVAGFVERMEALTVGDPADEATDIGPLAMARLRDNLARQVTRSVEAGARVLTGGRPLDRPGWFYAPTVLADIPEPAPAFGEELFGPVASMFRVGDVDAAVALANATVYGLGASAWTRDDGERQRFIDGIEAGGVFIGGMTASDPRLPFGGVKASGYGRELGAEGIHEFVNRKTVRISR